MEHKTVAAGVLETAYQEYGAEDGWPCIMVHGFPYDVQAYAEGAPILAEVGARVVVPYMRGYGPTRFLSDNTMRSGEQAAFGNDLLCLMDALGFEKAVVGGYDWGGRAACVVSALWPDRVTALVSGNSYNIQNIARAYEPAPAAQEAAYWYQYYFQSERGKRGLTETRREIARTLWGDPFLPAPLRVSSRRSCRRPYRNAAHCTASYRRPLRHHRRQHRWRRRLNRAPRQAFYGTIRLSSLRKSGPQSSAGAAKRVGPGCSGCARPCYVVSKEPMILV